MEESKWVSCYIGVSRRAGVERRPTRAESDSWEEETMAGTVVGGVQVGQTAPDFTLPSTLDEQVQVTALRGRPVLLAFFPLAFTSG